MRVRILKSIVTHVLVVDDGEHLVEDVREPVAVSASEWPTYYERLVAELEEMQERPDGEHGSTTSSVPQRQRKKAGS